ncbi:MAG TPA: RNA-binding cell elongation regulator Jag/EloR [Bacillota bacterium]|nr:RNA-binding cell elongation regulator Jag/EloR [Bacillota bacterium]
MKFSEKWGQDVEEAIQLALKDLKVTIDEVEVKVIEEPSKGFLGLGSKLAKVRVELKTEKDKEGKENQKKFREETKKNADANVKTTLKEKPSEKPREEKQVEEKPPKRKSTAAVRPDDLEELTRHEALDFLRETCEKMGLTLEITAKKNEECIYFDIEGKDAGTIIGKRGQTLDAMQYLTSLVVNKEKEKYIRVVLDAENYRAKREKTLEQLADRLAKKVEKTRRSVRLEPMNPYERMVIHATLQNHPKVKTRSEGEEPYRRVIIEHK